MTGNENWKSSISLRKILTLDINVNLFIFPFFRKPKVNGLNGLSNHNKDKWSRDHYDRDDVIDADVMSQRKIPNSYTTTLETTSFRRPSQLAETPGNNFVQPCVLPLTWVF